MHHFHSILLRSWLLALTLGLFLNIKGQPLQKGDIVFNFNEVLRKSTWSLNLNKNALKGKQIILDFWNVRCKSCIVGMPKLEALQKQFGDKVQFILITQNSENEVKALFQKVKISRPNLPMITGDKLFNQMFPHDAEPFQVWLDSSFKVMQLTDGHNATAQNVQRFIEDPSFSLMTRQILEGFNNNLPLIHEAGGRLYDQTTHYSVLVKGMYLQTASNFRRLDIDTASNTITFKAINIPLLSLYSVAYNRDLYGYDPIFVDRNRNNRIIAPQELTFPKDSNELDNWKQQHIVSYELKMSGVSEAEFFTAMKEDLNRYLPYTASIETRKVRCYVLQNCGLVPANNNDSAKGVRHVGKQRCFNQVPVSELVRALNYMNRYITLPIVDETGFCGMINMCIHGNFSELASLQKSLAENGINMVEEERLLPMLVIQHR